MAKLSDELKQIYASGDSFTVLKLLNKLIEKVDEYSHGYIHDLVVRDIDNTNSFRLRILSTREEPFTDFHIGKYSDTILSIMVGIYVVGKEDMILGTSPYGYYFSPANGGMAIMPLDLGTTYVVGGIVGEDVVTSL